MSKYQVTSGVIPAPVKVVLYGPEGIGKSTFASQFPDPIFIDAEGGTKQLDVRRLPRPTSWAMLLDEVAEVRKGNIPCTTLVLDTADWAEALCIQSICAKAKVDGLEGFGYGKGYVYAKEAFAKLLDELEEVVAGGRNVVVLAHAMIAKFEQPDAVGNYDRWQMKTTKQVAPLLREWCDMLLFANYKTVVEKSGSSPNAKNKASGGRRVLYTTHHPCWDAKNRFGLSDELPLDYQAIAAIIPGKSAPAPAERPILVEDEPANPTLPTRRTTPAPSASPSAATAAPAPTSTVNPTDTAPAHDPAAAEARYRAKLDADLRAAGIPDNLRALMVANKVEEEYIRHAVAQKGYFPEDMPVRDYPADFIDGCLVGAWDAVYEMVKEYGDVPF
ncbi:ATP-binding protein [Subdoligranulum variabile]|uniref:ATP-binding protein n=1 Tax=Subdoligranulum variabile TaxID=214851 RepID=UPI0026ED204C|nr:ATP-binding protein [Subdoligranulum variabile]